MMKSSQPSAVSRQQKNWTTWSIAVATLPEEALTTFSPRLSYVTASDVERKLKADR